jgi:hypothetical protein
MMRRFSPLFFILIFIGCSENLKAPAKSPARPKGLADIVISQEGEPVITTHFENLSDTDFMICARDRDQRIYIEARRFVTLPDHSVDGRLFSFFFPLNQTMGVRTQSEWVGSEVQIYGKAMPFRSLGAQLKGSCRANLLLTGAVLTGEISCQNFQNTDEDGIGQYDLQITHLLCTIR